MLNQEGYMQQEEEWEREGLLDPAWEKQQRKVSPYEQYRHCGNMKKRYIKRGT